MAEIKIKRSSVTGKIPAVADLALGELAINTFDGKLFLKRNNGTDAIVEIGSSGVSSFNTRTGAVTLSSGDVTTALGYTPLSNATSYLPLTGGTLTGNLNLPYSNVNTFGVNAEQVSTIGLGFSASGSNLWQVQAFNSAEPTGNLYFTHITEDPDKNIYVNNNEVLHAGNYSLYAPSVTGAGASGTWDIDITGNAATATTATTASNATTATTLQNARTIGGVSFNGSANINLPGVNTAGNQNTTGSAARLSIPDTRAVADEPQGKTARALSTDFKNNTAVNNPPVTANATYSHIITMAGWDTNGASGGWPSQLSLGDGIAIRQATSATVWGDWRTVLHSNNFNSYAPTLTGTGASGSWGISITGNAATATTATNVAYSGLTGTVPTWNQNTTGSAATLTNSRTIAMTGDVSYTSGSFNGSANVTGTATLASVGTAGTYTKVTTDAKGRVTAGTTLAAADIPNLDAGKITTGTIDAARLPSYVDDVLEAANLASFPATGETGKIYVALDTNKTYRWSGSAYVYITSGAVDSVAGKTGVVTLAKADVGLGNVDNTSDANKPVSTAQQTALNLKSNIASPTFTGTVTTPAINLSGGTANGVAYLNGSNVLTSGSALTYSGGALLNTGSFAPTDGTNIAEIKINAATLDFNTSSTVVPQVFRLGSAEQMRLTSTGLGIGTSSPDSKLTVVGATAGTGAAGLRIGYNGTSVNYFDADTQYFRNGAGSNSLILAATAQQYFISGSEQMRLTSTGLGIGTSSPTSKLVVSNAGALGLEFDPASGAMQVYNRSTSAYGTMNLLANTLYFRTGASPAISMALDASGNLGIGTSSPGVKLQVDANNPTRGIIGLLRNSASSGQTGAQLHLSQSGIADWVIGQPAGVSAIAFWRARNASADGTEYMRLDSSGNLGIGTTSPAYKLDVAGEVQISNGSALRWKDSSGTSYNLLYMYSDNNTYLSAPVTGSSLIFRGVGFSERMRLDASGNLGLGVTPSAWGGTGAPVLQLGGNSGNLAANTQYLNITANAYFNSGSYKYIGTGAATYYAQDSGRHFWYTAPSGTAGNAISFTQAMTLDASGNLGVGTTSPLTRLVVSNGSSENIEFSTGSVSLNGGVIQYLNRGGDSTRPDMNYYLSSGGGAHKFYTNDTERARIDSSGNFDLGTTGGADRYQNIIATSARLTFNAGTGFTGSAATSIYNQSAIAMVFGTNNTERARIDSSGNFGIGTTNPVYKLQVNGSFAATTKSFVIDHPTKPGMKLRYGSLEGPENGVYVRGKLTGNNTIELPEYWTKLVDADSITVNLTPIGKHQNLFVEDIVNNKVVVGNALGTSINCFYVVYAERVDVDKLQVEVG